MNFLSNCAVLMIMHILMEGLCLTNLTEVSHSSEGCLTHHTLQIQHQSEENRRLPFPEIGKNL